MKQQHRRHPLVVESPGQQCTSVIRDAQHALIVVLVRPEEPPFAIDESGSDSSGPVPVEPVPVILLSGALLDLVPPMPVVAGGVLVVPDAVRTDPVIITFAKRPVRTDTPLP